MFKIGQFRILSKKDWKTLVELRNDYLNKTNRAGLINVELSNIKYYLDNGNMEMAYRIIQERYIDPLTEDKAKVCGTNYDILAKANLLIIPKD